MIINVFICVMHLEWGLAHGKRPMSVSYYCHVSLSLVASGNMATRAAKLDGKSMMSFDARHVWV